MISFRTHVVTLVAVFLALAVGVVLGGGPLSELGRVDDNTDALEAEVAEVRAEADFADRFAADVSSTLLDGRLEDRDVALVTLPGADTAVVRTLSEQIAEAGGSVTVTQAIGSSLVNTGEKSLVDTLGSQLMTQLPDGAVTDGASTYQRAGELLGLTLATTGDDAEEVPSRVESVTEGLRGANLVEDVEAPSQRAPLVLLVLGDEVTGDGADALLGGLVTGLAEQARGLVVAARTSDGTDDQVARLREGDALGSASSVDGVETAAGQVAAVVALARAYDTQGGAFGAAGADGTVPLG